MVFFASSVPFAELMAAWSDVKAVVMDCNASHVWLEGDSIIVINWIKKILFLIITFRFLFFKT